MNSFLADLCFSFVRKQPKKEQKRKLLDCCIPVRLRTSGVDRACEVRDQARRPTRHSDYVMKKPSWCQLGAVPRYWKVVASCFQIVSFAENTSSPLAPRARIFQPILLLFFFCLFPCLNLSAKRCLRCFFYSVSNLVAFKRRQTLLKKGYFLTFSNI